MSGTGRPEDRFRVTQELSVERIGYDLAALRRSLDKHDANVLIFEEAIAKERALKDRTLEIIEELEAKQVREERTLDLVAVQEAD